MAQVDSTKVHSLVEDYLLEKKDKSPETTIQATHEADVKAPAGEAAEEVIEKIEETPLVVENTEVSNATIEASDESSNATGGEITEPVPGVELTNQDDHPIGNEASGNAHNEISADVEAVDETPEVKLETAPVDFRFPTTNQSRHCFTRYVEYHRCIAAKGDDNAPECQKFAKYYRSLCPGEWIDRWNEQRENGTFPGPL